LKSIIELLSPPVCADFQSAYFVPANNSATGLFQILNDNKGVGLLFETEGDTLVQTFKGEHGNYSDGFRKAFHHETISYNRRKDREYVELEKPCLSALLSGTPKQVSAPIPNAACVQRYRLSNSVRNGKNPCATRRNGF
jgi:hypothetical protein